MMVLAVEWRRKETALPRFQEQSVEWRLARVTTENLKIRFVFI
jgi:hypothetical protein